MYWTLDTRSQTHIFIRTPLDRLCLFTSEFASSAVLVEWVWVSEKEKSNTGFRKDLEQAEAAIHTPRSAATSQILDVDIIS